jgi:7-cyano-7-deazaguanine synthase
MSDDRALVLFSGGQDSTTCLAWALDRFDYVETVGFDYGQRHAVELDCRPIILDKIKTQFKNWASRVGDDHLIDLRVLGQIGDTAMTQEIEIETGENGLPTTFVPGRNLLFLTFAAAIAYRRGIKHIVGGMCETDFSGYPDCRDDTIKAMQLALNLGMDQRFVLHTPLMWIDKGQTWELAAGLGDDQLIQIIIEDTHTCYLADRSNRQPWGYGCGKCPACDLRSNGFSIFLEGENGRSRTN